MSIVTSSSGPVATGLREPDSPRWQASMRRAIRDPIDLCRRLDLPAKFEAGAVRAARLFPVFVPEEYLRRMTPGDVDDPLLRQVLPLVEEEDEVAGDALDPVGDRQATVVPGLLQKYQGRVLMVATGACAVHCRYCFRRHFPYDEGPKSVEAWRPALDQIASDRGIDEVILSGGDPWTLVDSTLAELTSRLEAIGHLRRLRIHTRLPIMIPSRVNDTLLDWLTGSRLTPIVVVHVNHAAEIDRPVADALLRLVDAGVVVMNQSVLLRGVNDAADALVQLSKRLVDLRVMPYYLHQLDRVRGAAHFDVPDAIGIDLIEQMRTRLPGYAVPRLVRENPGAPGKTILA